MAQSIIDRIRQSNRPPPPPPPTQEAPPRPPRDPASYGLVNNLERLGTRPGEYRIGR